MVINIRATGSTGERLVRVMTKSEASFRASCPSVKLRYVEFNRRGDILHNVADAYVGHFGPLSSPHILSYHPGILMFEDVMGIHEVASVLRRSGAAPARSLPHF